MPKTLHLDRIINLFLLLEKSFFKQALTFPLLLLRLIFMDLSYPQATNNSNMVNLERRENIAVDQDRSSVALITKQTTVHREVFPSIEKAVSNKRSSESWDKGKAVFFGGGGIVATFVGLTHIINGVNNRDINDVIVGGQLLALGAYFLQDMSKYLKAEELAKRQLEKLQSPVDTINPRRIDS